MRSGWPLLLAPILCGFGLWAQPLGVPAIDAKAKGPDQINLTWKPVANPGYGYLVEIQSDADHRYQSWQELRPIPAAAGYTCDHSVVLRNGRCGISDPGGVHVYNPPHRGVPYWVTEANYIDPQDDTPAQFIAAGLRANTGYHFRVRTYSGLKAESHGAYSNVASATTAAYPQHYVSPEGQDTNDGSAPDPAHAWKTLAHASAALACGHELIVLEGSYPADAVQMNQKCTAADKAVVMVNPGDEATITSVPAGAEHTMVLGGSHVVIDGLVSASSSEQNGDYDVQVVGDHAALFGIETHPAVVPAFKGGVALRGSHNLLYGAYLHDAGSPDSAQNPGGNGGFVLVVEGEAGNANVIWSNHLTRGGHDVSLCIRGAHHNRWLNNVMDGGWGMGWEAVQSATHNLVEGNFIFHVGQSVDFYKPAIEASSADNTVRRNLVVGAKSNAVEVSAIYGGDTAGHTRVYNNVFYAPGTCLFESRNGGAAAYDGVVYANNICSLFSGVGTDIYPDNRTSSIARNSFLPAGNGGQPEAGKAVIVWNHSAGDPFEYPRPVAFADGNYSPPFARNADLSVEAKFANESAFDFHLSAGSRLLGAGIAVEDPEWGSVAGKPDLGAFGISPSPPPQGFVPPKAAPAAPAPPPATAAPAVSAAAEFARLPRFGQAELDRPTLTAIGIQLPVAPGLSYQAVTTVRYREAGSETWREAMPLFRVHPDVVVGWDVNPQFGGSIFDLKPGTRYQVELHEVDPESGTDQRVMLAAATRALPHDPSAPHRRPVRSAEELKSALSSAQAGDIIELADGVYRGQFRIDAPGTRERPIVIRGASEEGTILDGDGCNDCNGFEVYGAGFVHIERLTIRSSERAIRFQTNGAEGNVVRRVHIRDTTLAIGAHPDQRDFYIADNTLEGRLKWPQEYRADDGAHSDDDGIQVMGNGHIVAYNRISGYGDAMKTSQRGARSVDFYGNDIRYSYDNGVELDEGAGNIRCFRNRFLNTYAPLSVQPIYGGPAYMLRNVVINVGDEQMKFHALGGNPPQEPSGILALHNTFVSAQVALNVETPLMSHYFLVANNLFVGPQGAGLIKVVNWDAPVATGVFDYNAYFPDGIFYFNLFKESVKSFPTLASLRTRGLETHGVALTGPVFENRFAIERDAKVFVQPVELVPAANSAAIDHGVYFPNINDGYAGRAPDLGAIETGCPAPIYGPRPEGMDESNMTVGCPPRADAPATSALEAMQLLARATGGAPTRPAAAVSRTPAAIAEEGLLLAAGGNLPGAFGVFNATNFPQPKQADFVREAYFELQVQSLVATGAARQCPQADRGITNLGYEDKNLPFTFYGFGALLKRPRVQYLVGGVELACVDEKSARKRWEKVSKSPAPLESTDFAYPLLALMRLDSLAAAPKLAAALDAVRRALSAAKGEQRGLLLYHQGLLLAAAGNALEAEASFTEGAGIASEMVRYLNLEALHRLK
jgi:hypothetical protein